MAKSVQMGDCVSVMIAHKVVVICTTVIVLVVIIVGVSVGVSVNGKSCVANHTPLENYILNGMNKVYKPAGGSLLYKYIAKTDSIDELWDFDAYMAGVSMVHNGALDYLEGSMMNFLSNTNKQTGAVAPCLTKSGSCSATGLHAKPIIIQGAYLAAYYRRDFGKFYQFLPQMEALLLYWTKVAVSNHIPWGSAEESGFFPHPGIPCNGPSFACWNSQDDLNKLVSPDVQTFIVREYQAYYHFCAQWRLDKKPITLEYLHLLSLNYTTYRQSLSDNNYIEPLGYYASVYLRNPQPSISHKDWQLCYPLYTSLMFGYQMEKCVQSLTANDIWTEHGIRSLSNTHAQYKNDELNEGHPSYFGPIWLHYNILYAYGLNEAGYTNYAFLLAEGLLNMVEAEFKSKKQMFQSYNSESFKGLHGPKGFFAIYGMVYDLKFLLQRSSNPFEISQLDEDVINSKVSRSRSKLN